MSLKLIYNNPYRVFGVLSNSPLKERVGNQHRLAAFAKIGKEVSFPNDFSEIIGEKPLRSSENITAAANDLNLNKDRLKFALFWFIKTTPMDDIALKHLQSGNIDKAKEIFLKKETFATLINSAVVAFIENDVSAGFINVSKVIHDQVYRAELLKTIGIDNLAITEVQLASLFISELLKEAPAKTLLSACTNENDRSIVCKEALNEPISSINTAISIAKSADTKSAVASLAAGTKLMESTKAPLKEVKDIAGASSQQYQMVADSVAKQVLQCGINYYNNAPDSDTESPRKAMVLQSYALAIAVGKLTKDRCKENYDILKKAVDNMPPAEVADEACKIKAELRKFCQLPDKISHSISLLNNTKPQLQTIKRKLGATNAFYLSLSTEVVGNALHNLIAEVNQAQNTFARTIEECKNHGINPYLLGSTPLDKIKSVVKEAWEATVLMDSFDLEYGFKTQRYDPNRQSLKKMCDDLGISNTPTPRSPGTTSTPTPPTTPPTGGDDDMPLGCWIAIIIAIIIFLANVAS